MHDEWSPKSVSLLQWQQIIILAWLFYMDECPICLLPFDNTSVTEIGCCHKHMHTKCYFNCMTLKPECPMCRAPQPPLDVVIPVPVPILIQNRPTAHANFVRYATSVTVIGVSLAVVVWTFNH